MATSKPIPPEISCNQLATLKSIEPYFLRFVLIRLWYSEENAANRIPVIGKMIQAVPQAL